MSFPFVKNSNMWYDLHARRAGYVAAGQRLGQALFNALEDVIPDLAHSIRGTGRDPFYNDAAIAACLEVIENHLFPPAADPQ